MQLATSGPLHNVQEEMLMQHFIHSLNPESVHFMNLTSKGSVMNKIVVEVRAILENVLDNTQFMGVFDDPPELDDQPKEKQQLHILSAAYSSPPQHIRKSPNHPSP